MGTPWGLHGDTMGTPWDLMGTPWSHATYCIASNCTTTAQHATYCMKARLNTAPFKSSICQRLGAARKLAGDSVSKCHHTSIVGRRRQPNSSTLIPSELARLLAANLCSCPNSTGWHHIRLSESSLLPIELFRRRLDSDNEMYATHRGRALPQSFNQRIQTQHSPRRCCRPSCF